MSQYTTGELARLCGVTVRTVQYYDTKGLLHPSELSEGGRRLYSEGDLGQMRLICTLRSLGLPLDAIRSIFQEENSAKVVGALLEEQDRRLTAEIRQKQAQRDTISQIRRGLAAPQGFVLENIPDIAHRMENRSKLRKVYAVMLSIGILVDLIEIGTILLWIFTGIWWPFAAGMVVVVGLGIVTVRMYYRKAAYLCPECHAQFQPRMREFFFATHTLRTRKLRCPRCGYRGWCVETYAGEQKA